MTVEVVRLVFGEHHLTRLYNLVRNFPKSSKKEEDLEEILGTGFYIIDRDIINPTDISIKILNSSFDTKSIEARFIYSVKIKFTVHNEQ